jgi:two-component system KDP operon response regulator KdpE
VTDPAAEAVRRTPRILVVEDDAINRALVRAVLTSATDPEVSGSTLVEVSTVAEARAAFAAARPDVVLLDVQLPDGNGLGLVGEIARAEAPCAVVALSAGVLSEQRAAALAAGCDAFVSKPYTADELLDTLLAHLPDSRADFRADSRPDPRADFRAASRSELRAASRADSASTPAPRWSDRDMRASSTSSCQD